MNPAPIRPRVTLGQLMAVVVVTAVIFAASSGAPSPAGLAGLILVILVDLGAFGTAILGIIYRRGAARGFWAGFVLFQAPALFWLFYLGLGLPGPDMMPLAFLLSGLVPFAWIGGTIGEQFGRAAEAARPFE